MITAAKLIRGRRPVRTYKPPKPNNRCPDDDRVYDEYEWEFILAMDEYKRRTGVKFPSWSEALGVLKALGYEKCR